MLDYRAQGQTGQAAPRYWYLSGVGVLMAAGFFAASLTPSLMPRPPLMQGALSGLSAALGYAIGAILLWLWRILALPTASDAALRWGRLICSAVAVLGALVALWFAADWQNATRAVLGVEPVKTSHPFQVGGVALLVFAVLWGLGSLFMFGVRQSGRALGRVMPGRTGLVLGLLATAYLFWAVGNGVLLRKGFELADAAFAAGEKVFTPDQVKPADPMMTGSDASLVRWEDLGNRGRDFVARTPSAEEIGGFYGDGAQRPVRVYVGRVASDDPRERAELALQELIRQGGFERELLIITTPVGTGWMDPGSHDVIDFMWGGDTAHVGVQYSYLTSVLSILTNVEYGLDQARELFTVVYRYWRELPPETRPKLYLHGLSQGALNSQAATPFFSTFGDPLDGAFWAGSPFISPIWRQVIRNRAPDSPSWRPIAGDGSLVRVTNQDNVLNDPGFAPWDTTRVIFLSYASDPIVNFDTSIFWQAPDWLGPDRPRDIAPEMRWFPFVTAFQVGLDMTTALNVPGYGHFYFYRDYIPAWAELTDPPGWSAARTQDLTDLFSQRPDPW